MLEVIGTALALGLSAAASSSALLTTIRVLLPDVRRSLPWWFAAGCFTGFALGALGALELFRLLAVSAGRSAPAARSVGFEIALGVALLLCAVLLLRAREATSPLVRRLIHRYGRIRIKKAWTPQRLFLLGSRLVFRPRGALITLTAALVVKSASASALEDVLGAAVFGLTSTAAVLGLVITFFRAPERSRLRSEQIRQWLTANAAGVAASVAAITGGALVLRALLA